MATILHKNSENNALLRDALSGLFASPKTLPSKYFYDAEGSRLFEAICELPEYHVTRIETALLQEIISDLVAYLPQDAALVEFGSGASVKTRMLLDGLPRLGCYIPVDISLPALNAAAAALADGYPDLTVSPLVGDFTAGLELPPCVGQLPIIGFFPGSTIGNLAPADAQEFLAMARKLLGPGSTLILGVDHTRAASLLLPAYDDAQGVTAAFNKNVLVRLNRECGAAFDLSTFDHLALWNATEGRMEMHLASTRDQTVLLNDRPVRFTAADTIHTENSYKYTPAQVDDMSRAAGWTTGRTWVSHVTAPNGEQWSFGITLLRA